MTVWGRLTGLASYLYIFFPVLEVPNIEQRDKMEKLFFVEGVEAYFFFEFGLFYFYFLQSAALYSFILCSMLFTVDGSIQRLSQCKTQV